MYHEKQKNWRRVKKFDILFDKNMEQKLIKPLLARLFSIFILNVKIISLTRTVA